jgi:SAM-dependent methyltransferase
MNAEQMDFEADSFDLICGCAILHHLNLDKAYAELGRVLDRNGRAVFLEPLGHNPAINLYRRLTPSIRTADEHPLLARDFDAARLSFDRIELQFFALSSLLAVPFRSFRFFNSLRQSCDAVDRLLFRAVPASSWYAWEVVMEFSQPKKP